MGCPHIQQTARALRSRSHAIFRMYGQRDARPTPVVLLFCVCCIADPAPAAHCPALVYIRPVLSPGTACRACAPPGCTPSPLFHGRHPRGVFAGAVSPRGAMTYIALSACTKRAPHRWRMRRPNRKESYGLSYCVSLYYTGLLSAMDCNISSRDLRARP